MKTTIAIKLETPSDEVYCDDSQGFGNTLIESHEFVTEFDCTPSEAVAATFVRVLLALEHSSKVNLLAAIVHCVYECEESENSIKDKRDERDELAHRFYSAALDLEEVTEKRFKETIECMAKHFTKKTTRD